MSLLKFASLITFSDEPYQLETGNCKLQTGNWKLETVYSPLPASQLPTDHARHKEVPLIVVGRLFEGFLLTEARTDYVLPRSR